MLDTLAIALLIFDNSLAYSELYLSFAYIFRLLKLEVHDTTRQDLEWRDFYAPMTKGHLKVAVRGRWQ